MKFNGCIRILAVAALSLPSLAMSQGAGANPFGSGPKAASVSAVDITKSQALAELTSADRAKVEPNHLTKILDKAPNTPETKADRIIVEYFQNVVTEAQAMSKSDRKKTNAEIDAKRKSDSLEFNRIKQNSLSRFDATEVELIQDYEVLPLTVVSIKNKKGLVKLLKDSNVKAIYKNNTYTTQLTQSLPFIGQYAAANVGFLGQGTMVVVLDTGVNYSHPVFGPCSSPSVPTNSCKVKVLQEIAAPDGSIDDDGHGTNVSGIVIGVAPGTKLAVFDVTTLENGNQSAYDQDVIDGITWSIQNKTNYNIVAINLSIGTETVSALPCYTAASVWMLSARVNNILPIVSSGNSSSSIGISSPACASGAVSVGSVNDATNLIASDSNSANLLTLLAPGVNITAGGLTLSGTSMAAPHVAGAVAVLSAAFPNDSAEQILVRITNSGVPMRDPRNGIVKPRLDLRAALGNLIPPTVPPTTPPVVTGDVDIVPILDILLLSD